MRLTTPRGFTNRRAGSKNIVSCDRCGRTWRWHAPYQEDDIQQLVNHLVVCDPLNQPLWRRYGLDPLAIGLE